MSGLRGGIDVRFETEITAVDADTKTATLSTLDGSTSESVDFDAAHVVPPQNAPDWLKDSPVADVAEGVALTVRIAGAPDRTVARRAG